MYSWIPKDPWEHKKAAALRAEGFIGSIADYAGFKRDHPFFTAHVYEPHHHVAGIGVTATADGVTTETRKVDNSDARAFFAFTTGGAAPPRPSPSAGTSSKPSSAVTFAAQIDAAVAANTSGEHLGLRPDDHQALMQAPVAKSPEQRAADRQKLVRGNMTRLLDEVAAQGGGLDSVSGAKIFEALDQRITSAESSKAGAALQKTAVYDLEALAALAGAFGVDPSQLSGARSRIAQLW